MDLAKIQDLSLVTKAVTLGLGVIQSIVVVRLLTQGEFGLVGLVMSIGSVIGVSQHLGIVDGAIREIAVLKNRREVGKVFWVSHIARQAVTIPLSVGLFLLASFIAVKFYKRPDIVPYIQIFALSLILQGLQDVLGATLTGIKKFVQLYVGQIVTAVINIGVFSYFTWRWNIAGFFWAVIVTTSIMVVLYMVMIARDLRGDLALPTWQDIRLYGKRVMRVGFYMYLSRIFFVVWQRLPLLLLGALISADELGELNLSLTFGGKLTIVAMALSEVNLSWMSSLYARERKEFERAVTHNMHRVLVIMLLFTLALVFFTPEILQYVIKGYAGAQPLILVMTLAFFLYALTDIGTSSVFVPADKPRYRAITYGVMTAVTALCIYLWRTSGGFGAALSVLLGAVINYVLVLWISKRTFSINLVTLRLGGFLLALAAAIGWLMASPPLVWRVIVFLLFTGYMFYEAHKHALLPAFVSTLIGKHTTPEATVTFDLSQLTIICFAGSAYDSLAWTNRQHIMSRVSKTYPVLYVEPRVWLVRYIWLHWYKPLFLLRFIKRLCWYEKVNDTLFIKAQWNLIPGSREVRLISALNHYLNRWHLLLIAWKLGFLKDPQAVWIYDTEANEYLSAFPKATVLYDCVDDHAAQAGVDRNSAKVIEEEKQIMRRATVVTVTSRHLFTIKKHQHQNIHLVLNAGNVELFLKPTPMHLETKAFQRLLAIPSPIIGSVGTIDSYKMDWVLVEQVARQRPDWQFVFIGTPLMGKSKKDVRRLRKMKNIHFLGSVKQEDVPAFVRLFDVFTIPYKASKYNEASFPLKFWEFMATGKPIIISGVPELKMYKPMVHYVKSHRDMISAIAASLLAPHDGAADRIAEAKHHTWEKRTQTLLKLLEQALTKS